MCRRRWATGYNNRTTGTTTRRACHNTRGAAHTGLAAIRRTNRDIATRQRRASTAHERDGTAVVATVATAQAQVATDATVAATHARSTTNTGFAIGIATSKCNVAASGSCTTARMDLHCTTVTCGCTSARKMHIATSRPHTSSYVNTTTFTFLT